jgi:hypothetical protein
MNVRTCTSCGSDYLGAGASGAGSLCPKCRSAQSVPGPAQPSALVAKPSPPARAVPPALAPAIVPSTPQSAPAPVTKTVSRPQPPPGRSTVSARRPGATIRTDRLLERAAVTLLALIVTSLVAWVARPSQPSVPAATAGPTAATARPIALEVRLARPPSALGLTTTTEGKLDPGPLVGSDKADVVALALAALPGAEATGMVVRRDDDLTGNFLVPLGFAGGDQHDGLLLDPTGSGAGTPGKATFMGAEASGRRFLIIADRSGSMSGAKFERLVTEINQTVKGLKSGAKFYVIFYDDTAVPYPGTRWLSGRRDAASLEQWMNDMGTGGLTNPLPAFQIAFTQVHPRPDAIFFMTDGLFAPTVADIIPTLNAARRVVPIHSISFVDRSAEPWLRKIAEDSKGTYRHVDLTTP